MNAFVCELCGSNDIVKENGLFVCQHCGTKYTADEARKLMGTVKIDRMEEFNKYRQAGNTYIVNGDFESAYEYFSKALEIVPDDEISFMFRVCSKFELSLKDIDCLMNINQIINRISTDFCVLTDIVVKKNQNTLSDSKTTDKFKLNISTFDKMGRKLASAIEEFIDYRTDKYGERDKWISESSEDIESINNLYVIMNKKMRKVCGDNSVPVQFCNEKWKDYLSKNDQYFTTLDSRSIIRSFSNQPASETGSGKKGIFGRLFSK